MDVPENIISDLKCNYCNQYLSRGPVYLYHNDETTSKCGRCSSNDNESGAKKMKKSRNLPYEKFAGEFKFPCIYKENGCNQKLVFSSNQQLLHESKCEYKKYPCPIEQCEWNDVLVKLLEHCQSVHPKSILTNGGSLKKLIKDSNNMNYLMEYFNTLYLFKQIFDKNSVKIHCSVLYIQLGETQKQNDYKLEIEIQQDEKLLRTGQQILPEEDLKSIKKYDIDIKRTTLQDIFDENAEIIFTFKILPTKQSMKKRKMDTNENTEKEEIRIQQT